MHAAVVKSFVCLRVVKSWTTTEFVFEKLPICQNSLSKLEIVLTIDGMYRGINCISLYFKVITIHFHSQTQVWTEFIQPRAAPSGGGELPYISYIGMCCPIGYGFCAVLVWKRVYALPILVWNRLRFSGELRECMKVFIVSIPNE